MPLPCYGEWFYGVEKPRGLLKSSSKVQMMNNLEITRCFALMANLKWCVLIQIDLQNIKWTFLIVIGSAFLMPVWVILYRGAKSKKPECLAELLEYARKLSKPFIHARVDFYIVKDKIYFGEITFTNGAGFDRCSFL